jgi:multidrug efflux system membrane fusion protein
MRTIMGISRALVRAGGWTLWVLTRPPVLLGRGTRWLATSFRFWVLLLLAFVVLLVAYYAGADRYTPLTTDAYVQAYVIQVAPQVPGQVARVYVREGDHVKQGDLLFELDARPFEHKVTYLQAKRVEVTQQVKRLKTELAAARAEHTRLLAEADYARAVHRQEVRIFKTDSTTERKYLASVGQRKASQAAARRAALLAQSAQEALDAQVGDEHALLAMVQAQLATARLNLSYARVFAPCDGVITDLQLRAGAYVHTGQGALTLIDTSRWLIVANFRENALVRLRPGQPALVALHGEPGRLLAARVESVGWGVGAGQGIPSGVLPEVKRPGSWVPPAQRFQVRLALDEPEAVPLRVGMTGSVSVYTEPQNRLNRLTRAVHQAIAWLYYL